MTIWKRTPYNYTLTERKRIGYHLVSSIFNTRITVLMTTWQNSSGWTKICPAYIVHNNTTEEGLLVACSLSNLFFSSFQVSSSRHPSFGVPSGHVEIFLLDPAQSIFFFHEPPSFTWSFSHAGSIIIGNISFSSNWISGRLLNCHGKKKVKRAILILINLNLLILQI